jgi:hypothetical protein
MLSGLRDGRGSRKAERLRQLSDLQVPDPGNAGEGRPSRGLHRNRGLFLKEPIARVAPNARRGPPLGFFACGCSVWAPCALFVSRPPGCSSTTAGTGSCSTVAGGRPSIAVMVSAPGWSPTPAAKSSGRSVVSQENGVVPQVAPVSFEGLGIEPHDVVHTSHPIYGYLIRAGDRAIAWAPEFWELPDRVAGVDLLFADAAGRRQPIRFARGRRTRGRARHRGARREAGRAPPGVLAHPTTGHPGPRSGRGLPFGEFGSDGALYRPASRIQAG